MCLLILAQIALTSFLRSVPVLLSWLTLLLHSRTPANKSGHFNKGHLGQRSERGSRTCEVCKAFSQLSSGLTGLLKVSRCIKTKHISMSAGTKIQFSVSSSWQPFTVQILSKFKNPILQAPPFSIFFILHLCVQSNTLLGLGDSSGSHHDLPEVILRQGANTKTIQRNIQFSLKRARELKERCVLPFRLVIVSST